MSTIRIIKADIDKCIGCRTCEVFCSAFHAEPKYNTANPKRSRIRVLWNEEDNLFIPIVAGQYTEAECNGRNIIVIAGKEYKECSFCRASCPSRDLFSEPDADIPLKCDMCGEPMRPGGPLCVQVCMEEALTYVEREGEEDGVTVDEN